MPAKSLGLFVALAAALGGCSSSANDPNSAVYDAWRRQQSHLEVTASGSVASVLGVSSGPSGKHEGFLLHLRGSGGHGLTVRVEDNVDITGPIPLAAGDDVEVRGEYIYAADGGLIHYTHRDPLGRHAGGYVRVQGRVFMMIQNSLHAVYKRFSARLY